MQTLNGYSLYQGCAIKSSKLRLLEILDNMCIAIFCFTGGDVINFEINFIFPIKTCFT